MPQATNAEMQAAVDAAKDAFKSWSQTSVMTRQSVMFNLSRIIRDNMVGV